MFTWCLTDQGAGMERIRVTRSESDWGARTAGQQPGLKQVRTV